MDAPIPRRRLAHSFLPSCTAAVCFDPRSSIHLCSVSGDVDVPRRCNNSARGRICAMRIFGKVALNIKRNIICNAGQCKESHPRANSPGAPRCCERGRRFCSREKPAQGMQLACSTYDAQLYVASTAIRSAAVQQLSAHRSHRQSH